MKRAALALCLCALTPTARADSVASRWLDDLHALERMISETYPNLDATTLDLQKLAADTEQRLAGVHTDEEGERVLRAFVAQFHDGHFTLKRSTAQAQATVPIALTSRTPGDVACKALLESSRDHSSFLFPLSRELGFAPAQGTLFPSTTLALDHAVVGFVRIVSFDASQYPDVCAREWERYRAHVGSSCNDDCRDQFVDVVVGNRLLAEFEATVHELGRVDALVLDLTDNGGGNDWVGAVMRMLTKQPIACGQSGWIRHAHWRDSFTKQRDQLKRKLAAKHDPVVQRQLARVEEDLREASIACDRSGIWTGQRPACELVVRRQLDECAPNEDFHFTPGAYAGRLFVLVNANTASASEDLVGRYKDSHLATIIGERTYGAGCGFTNGGIPLVLPHSGLHVRIPDCARFLRDGTNEVRGIAPDVVLKMSDLRSAAFSARLADALRVALRSPAPAR